MLNEERPRFGARHDNPYHWNSDLRPREIECDGLIEPGVTHPVNDELDVFIHGGMLA